MRLQSLSLALIAMVAARTAGAADLIGEVTARGQLPPPAPVDRALDPDCPPASPGDDPLLVSPSGGLANAVVRLLGPQVPVAGELPAVVIMQHACSYTPRVQIARTGQRIEVVNADGVLHNLHGFSDRRSLFNVAQPAGSPPVTRELKGVDVLRLKCDIHPWMFGWVVFSENSYAAVTSPEGRFTIHGVPPGRYRLSVWHELLGTRELQIDVGSAPVHVAVDLAPATAPAAPPRR